MTPQSQCLRHEHAYLWEVSRDTACSIVVPSSYVVLSQRERSLCGVSRRLVRPKRLRLQVSAGRNVGSRSSAESRRSYTDNPQILAASVEYTWPLRAVCDVETRGIRFRRRGPVRSRRTCGSPPGSARQRGAFILCATLLGPFVYEDWQQSSVSVRPRFSMTNKME